MASLNPQPVFPYSFDDGKTWRIIDAATNSPARSEHGDFLDGGGYSHGGIADAGARRINWERGIYGDEPRIAYEAFRDYVLKASVEATPTDVAPAVDDSKWLTVGQAADEQGMTSDRITKAANSGKLRTNGKKGRARRIDPASLCAWSLRRAEANRPGNVAK